MRFLITEYLNLSNIRISLKNIRNKRALFLWRGFFQLFEGESWRQNYRASKLPPSILLRWRFCFDESFIMRLHRDRHSWADEYILPIHAPLNDVHFWRQLFSQCEMLAIFSETRSANVHCIKSSSREHRICIQMSENKREKFHAKQEGTARNKKDAFKCAMYVLPGGVRSY